MVMSSNGSRGLIPSFECLEERALELRFLFWGGVLSLIVCGSALFALGHGGGHLPLAYSMFQQNHLPPGDGKARSKIMLSCEPVTTSEGSMIKVTAVVSGEDSGPTPTGKVNFLSGWDSFEKETLVNGSVSVNAKQLHDNNLSLRAIYLGDINYKSARSFDKSNEPDTDSSDRKQSQSCFVR